jgi:hypothetical protein
MRRLAVALTALTVAATPALAQNGCPAGALTQTRDLQCNAADLFAYMAPQLGTAVAGGSHTLGLGTTVGGLPHFAVAVRLNAVLGAAPQLGPLTSPNTSPGTNLDTKSAMVAFPTVDASVGLFKGIGLGVTRVGGVDLLASATYVPEVDAGAVAIAPTDGALKIGYGVRVGLLQQSLIVPGVTFRFPQSRGERRELQHAGLRAHHELVATQCAEESPDASGGGGVRSGLV